MSRQPIMFARDQFEGPSLGFVLSVVVVDVGPRAGGAFAAESAVCGSDTRCVHSFVLASRNLINENWTGWNAFINRQHTWPFSGGRSDRTPHTPRSTGPQARREPGRRERASSRRRETRQGRGSCPACPNPETYRPRTWKRTSHTRHGFKRTNIAHLNPNVSRFQGEDPILRYIFEHQ